MCLFLSDHVTRLSKRFTTDRTNIRFLFSMNTLISTKHLVRWFSYNHLLHLFVDYLFEMGLFMSDHDTRMRKRFTTDRSSVRFLFSMNTLISTEFREMVQL